MSDTFIGSLLPIAAAQLSAQSLSWATDMNGPKAPFITT
jgi:hypothetical protein